MATLLLASISTVTWAQSTPNTDNPSLTDAGVSNGSVPDDSRDPKETGIDDGDAMSSGLAGDVVKGGDSGGQDLPPDLGDDGGDDDGTEENAGSEGEEGGERSHGDGSEGHRAHTVDIVMEVILTSSDGLVVRMVRLHFKRHHGRAVLVGATSARSRQ
ncbi:MAG: hypothetical protein ACI9EF_000147 [Pseudohongiellaceae bacterium]|jgi:hypothetical protein